MKYGMPTLTGIFLGTVAFNILKSKKKERPVLDFLMSLIWAVFFIFFIVLITNHISNSI